MAGAYPSFRSMKQLRVLLFPLPPPLDGMLGHRRVPPSSISPIPILYTWVERDTVNLMPLVDGRDWASNCQP